MLKTQLTPTIQEPGIASNPRAPNVVPAVKKPWRYVVFFTAKIRNPHTRRAYGRACARFFARCEQRGLTLTAIRTRAA